MNKLISYFQESVLKFEKLKSETSIQIVLIPGNDEVKEVALQLQNEGFDVRPILYLTVSKGKERLRIVLHAFNTITEVEQLVKILS